MLLKKLKVTIMMCQRKRVLSDFIEFTSLGMLAIVNLPGLLSS